MRKYNWVFIAAILAGVTAAYSPQTSFGDTRIVALDGAPAPGAGAGVNFSFSPWPPHPVLNNVGQVAFGSNTNNPDPESGSGDGIWSEGGGNGLELVAYIGQQAPGAPDGVNFKVFDSSNPPAFNDLGQTAFVASQVGAGGIWSEAAGNGLELVARSGDIAPGTNDAIFGGFSRIPSINNSGQTLIHVSLDHSISGVDFDNDRGLWIKDATGTLQLVAREGDQAPGMPSGINFAQVSNIDPFLGQSDLNDLGHIAFRATFGEGFQWGIWSNRDGNGLEPIVVRGDPAPDTDGGNFYSIDGPVISEAGEITFRGTTGDRSGAGIWTEVGGNGLQRIIGEGDQAPGMPDGETFRSLFVNMKSSGEIAFSAHLNSGLEGLWAGDIDGVRLVALEGDQAPGAPDGVVFDGINGIGVQNDLGQVAFLARLIGPGIEPFTEFGVWAEDSSGVLRLVALEGNQLGVPIGFNNLGQLLLTNASGIIVVDVVPEPATIIYVGVGLAAVGFLRSRRRLIG